MSADYAQEAMSRVLERNKRRVNFNSIEVPEMKTAKGLKTLTEENRDLLKDYGTLLREAQTLLDRIPTGNIEEILGHSATIEEVMEFKAVEALNRDAVTNVLKMRRLVTAILVKAGR